MQEHIIKLKYLPSKPKDVICYLDGGLLRHFDNGIEDARQHFIDNGYTLDRRDRYQDYTGYIVEQIEITK